MQRRRGASLIECLVVMAVLSSVTTMGATTIVMLLRAEGTGTEALVGATGLSRLAHDFRRDVHAAVDVQVQPQEISLTSPDGPSVVYRAADDEVLRIERRDGNAVATESYILPGGAKRFEKVGDTRIVALIYARQTKAGPSKSGGRPREVRVEAAWGRDHRFSAPAESLESNGN